MLAQIAQEAWDKPTLDYHALAPEIVLLSVACLLVIVDSVYLERAKRLAAPLAGIGLIAAFIPILTLAIDGQDRAMFGGAYVVDDFALVMKGVFLASGYVVILLSSNTLAEGDYWESEYYGLLVSSLLGMLLMSSARDLVSIFVSLELLSIPAYLMATWKKRDLKSNEAGIKYYLMGVFASAIFLYGMSLLYGATGSTLLTDVNDAISATDSPLSVVTLGIIFVIVGFAFKVSAFPFHTWAPDTYEGAPTPVTAFLSVASKAAGFVAVMQLVVVGFYGRSDVYEPVIWILAAGSMTAGNLLALRQDNLVRMMAYSGVAQAGYIIAPLAIAGHSPDTADVAVTASVTYLAVYAAMNLGVFAVIIAIARKTGSAEIPSYGGSIQYAPALTVAMTFFLLALAGIPPFGGWFAKFGIFFALVEPGTVSGTLLAVVAAVNSVIALFYYLAVLRRMWADDVPDGDLAPLRTPPAVGTAVLIAAVVTLVFGVLPGVVTDVTEVSLVASALGG